MRFDMRMFTLVTLVLASAACGDGSSNGAGLDADDDVVTDGGADLGEGDSGPDGDQADVLADVGEPDATVFTCDDGDPESCLYPVASPVEVEETAVSGLTYTDAVGFEREVRIAIRRPVGLDELTPIIVLSHGGAEGHLNPLTSMHEWAEFLAGQGYVTVAVAHPGRDGDAQTEMCAYLGVPDDEICAIKLHWDRPHDVARALEYLDALAESDAGRLLDLDHMAHLGHSAGAGCTEMLAGAPRNFACAKPFAFDPPQDCDVADLVSLAEPRFDAFVALSLTGPGSEGFMEESFADLDAPILIATGLNDGDPGEPANRLEVFPLLDAEDQYQIYLDDPGARHTLFSGDLDACSTETNPARCEDLRRWLFSTGLAFLDAHLRDDPIAQAWLAGDFIETASQSTADWQRK